jgi:hypothetical protein
MKGTGVAIVFAVVVFNLFLSGCEKRAACERGGIPETARIPPHTVPSDIKAEKVESRSTEGPRPDSLASSQSPDDRRTETNLTRSNLPETAHQDPAKTRRLLNTITESAPDKLARNKKINEVRQARMQAIQRQMQMQSREQQASESGR